MRNIYLIGMMGAGKTATGRALAGLAGMDFVDLDEEIEDRTRQSVNEIFEKQGEPYFRAEEKKALRQASAGKNTVISTGGGVVLDPENVALMKSTGTLIYLVASFEALWDRVRDKRDRPLLRVSDPKAAFLALFRMRVPLYESACAQKVETYAFSPEAVAQKIADLHLE